MAKTFRDGYQAYGITNAEPLFRQFSMKNAQIFDEFPTWKNLGFLPEEARKQAMADPRAGASCETRWPSPSRITFHRHWGTCIRRESGQPNIKCVGKSVKELRRCAISIPRRVPGSSLEDDLDTIFATDRGFNPESMRRS